MTFDIGIIGGGPGGYAAAFEAIANGLTVVLFENRELGGTCLNRGCVPTKFFLHVSDTKKQLDSIAPLGFKIENYSLNYDTSQDKKNEIVNNLRTNLTNRLYQVGVKVINASASIISKHIIEADGIEYECESIIVASGSIPSGKMFNKNAICSDEILNLRFIPPSISIIGGGVVAVEMATIFNQLGSKVTIYIRGDRVLRKWDKDISTSLTQSLKKAGIDIITKCSESDFNNIQDEIILSAVGREPNLPGFPEFMINLDDNRAIIVNQNYQTNVDNIYAVGDVISGSPMLAHIASEQGKQVVRYICRKVPCSSYAVCSCIYTLPEVASVGYSEVTASESGIDYISIRIPMFSNARSMISDNGRSFMKCLVEKNSGKIIGAHMICDRATDIISEFSLAIQNEMTIKDMLNNVRPHPSYVETITELLESIDERLKK